MKNKKMQDEFLLTLESINDNLSHIADRLQDIACSLNGDNKTNSIIETPKPDALGMTEGGTQSGEDDIKKISNNLYKFIKHYEDKK